MSKRAVNLLRKQMAFPMEAKVNSLEVAGGTTLSGQMTNRRKTVHIDNTSRTLLASESVAVTNGVSITMHISAQAIGDRIRITSNGTNWYVEGLTNAAVGIAT